MMYEFKTTFWSDFTIADHFGKAAVEDTFVRAFYSWKSNTEYVTELAIVVNWKCWEHWEKGDNVLGLLYHDLYYKVRDWCLDNLKGEDLSYYLATTD